MTKQHLLLLLITLACNGCGVSGVTLNSMYLKQNYSGVVLHANRYEKLDDYGVLRICQSLLKVQRFNDYYPCVEELKNRASNQQGSLSGQIERDLLPKSLTTAIFDTMQAEVELGLGNYNKSIALGERALRSLDAEPYSITTIVDVAGTNYDVINVLLAAYPATENRAKTLEMIERTKGLADFKYYDDHGFRLIGDFKILPMLTQAYYALSDYEEALNYSRLAIENSESLGFFESSFYSAMKALNSTVIDEQSADGNMQTFVDTMFAHRLQPRVIKARSELELGNFGEAQAGFDEILSSKLIVGITSTYYPVLHDRGRVAEALGDDVLATQYYRESIAVIESSRASIKTDTSKIAYVGNKQAVYESLVKILYRQNRIAESFEVAENAKARALVDLLASRAESRTATVAMISTTTPAAKEFNDLQAGIDSKSIAETVQTRGVDRGLLRKARKKLNDEAPEYASLVTVNPVSKNDIQGLLGDGELLLEYYVTENDLFIFALTQRKISAVHLQSNQLHELVSRFRASLNQPKSDDHKLPGRELYDHLIRPLAKEVDGADALSIVPHGVLHYLPFDALYDGRDYLIDSKAIRMLPSASVLKFLQKKTGPQNAILVLGNPDLQDSNLDLAGAQREAIAIARIQNNSRLMLREKATETVVKADAGAYRYLHFASHGVFDDETPLESRLLLAKDAVNDGNLTVSELYNLRLDADLVTLSACETALGRVANGDDVVGFTRGFLYAGANSIVSSLWKVDDEATYRLMLNFYRNLGSMDKRQALTQAQLTVRRQYRHPYYWAAFQLTGSI